MLVIRNLEELQKLNIEKTAVALGKFDGLHRGHREIINALMREKANGYISLVFTFSRNPQSMRTEKKQERLYTETEAMLVYEKLGIDIIVVCPVESEVLSMTPEQFVREILADRLGVKKIICGKNFRFGKDRSGDADTLAEYGEKYGYETKVIDMITENGCVISSTSIREYIKSGDMETAEKMLGHRYSIVGRVVHGNEIGRKLMTPTANIIVEEGKLVPPYGVYISFCTIDGKTYKGVTNIGIKPTVQEKEKFLGVETYFLDYHGDLYGKILEIELARHTRAEMKFESLDALKEQLARDKEQCRQFRG